jgi:hypothetical protein
MIEERTIDTTPPPLLGFLPVEPQTAAISKGSLSEDQG